MYFSLLTLVALSPKLREILETLEAKHSGLEQSQKAIATTGCLRRDPIETIVSIVPIAHLEILADGTSTPSFALILSLAGRPCL